jgi:hypothetical protein
LLTIPPGNPINGNREDPRKMTKEDLIKKLDYIKEKNPELYRHICGLIKAVIK